MENGIDVKDRIKDIEQGIDLADIRIIQNPREGVKVAWDLLRAAKQEILIMASTSNAFRRQVKRGYYSC
jgi:two-component system, OmpR family, sensor histidine kinase VicK